MNTTVAIKILSMREHPKNNLTFRPFKPTFAGSSRISTTEEEI
jgi:hypothetical protein